MISNNNTTEIKFIQDIEQISEICDLIMNKLIC